MSILANALWLLCGLSAVVLAALTGRRWTGRVGLALGFTLAVVAIPAWVSLQIEWTGGLAAAGAAVLLFRPRYAMVASIAGGALAAILGLLISRGKGIPQTVALAATAILVILPAVLASRNARLTGEEIRDEALLSICLAGLVVALTPGIQEGWRSAAALNVGGAGLDAGLAIPAWTVWVAAISLLLGGAHYVWRRQ